MYDRSMPVTIRAAVAGDMETVSHIYNDAVLNTTAIWNSATVDAENRRTWLAERQAGAYPVIVAELGGTVCGYAALGPFRPFEGYRHTAELSLYVKDGHRGAGLGSKLLAALTDAGRQSGLHVLVAAIEASNASSVALHTKFGFENVGRMPEVGRKFGRWLDLIIMQKTL